MNGTHSNAANVVCDVMSEPPVRFSGRGRAFVKAIFMRQVEGEGFPPWCREVASHRVFAARFAATRRRGVGHCGTAQRTRPVTFEFVRRSQGCSETQKSTVQAVVKTVGQQHRRIGLTCVDFDPLSDPLSGENCERRRPGTAYPNSTHVLDLRLRRTLAKPGDRDENRPGFDS